MLWGLNITEPLRGWGCPHIGRNMAPQILPFNLPECPNQNDNNTKQMTGKQHMSHKTMLFKEGKEDKN